MALKDRLKEARLRLDLTLDEVAQEVGVSRQTIQRYESGVISNIPSDNIEKLAKALKTTPAELMGWDATSAKVTINDNSLEQDLFQYYTHRPKSVRKEIIKRLKDMDITFAKNVRNLLQQSGDINGFMQYTDLDFAEVGKFMQGEPTTISSSAALRVAGFFKVNIVDLYFDKPTLSKDKDENTKESSESEIRNDKPSYKLDNTETGDNLKPFF